MDLITNLDDFNNDAKRFIRATSETFDSAFRKIVFLLFKNIVFLTPVDTGRARSNWTVGIDAPAAGVGLLDGSEAITEAQAASLSVNQAESAVGGLSLGNVAYLSNNVEYIAGLEDGINGGPAFNMVKGSISIVQAGMAGALE